MVGQYLQRSRPEIAYYQYLYTGRKLDMLIRKLLPALVAALTLGMAMPAQSADAPAEHAPAKITNLTVGVLPISDTVAIYIADKQGLFAKRGLSIKVVPAPGGAAATSGLLSGQMQFAFGSYVPFILAAAKGAPLVLASPTEMTSGVPSGLVVLANSKYKKTAELAGAKIAVSALANIGTVAIREQISAAGVDAASIKYVALPFPNMLAALEHGQVDAAWLVEPFLTQALEMGARVLFNPFAAPMPDVPMAGYMATKKYVADNPQIVARFNEALQEGADIAKKNPQTYRDMLPTYTKIPPTVAAKMQLNTFSSQAPQAGMQKLADLMAKSKLLDGHFDVAPLYQH
jgi:NitT/TauT family transport system substrate-binding protein